MSHESRARKVIYSEESEWSLAGEYSAIWNTNVAPPDLIEFLQSHPEMTPAQRGRLLLLDQARSWSSGPGRTVEEYLKLCPEIESDRILLVKMLAREYCLRDNAQSVSEFVDRFPTLRADLLRKLYGEHDNATSGNQYEQVLEGCLSDETHASDLDPVSELESLETAVEASVFAPRPIVRDESEDATSARAASRKPASTAKPTISSECRLRECFPFNTLPVELVDEVEAQMVERRYSAKEFLTRQGDPGDCLFLIRNGTVGIVVNDEHGIAHEIDRSTTGDVLGEMALLTDEPRSASLIALDDVTAMLLPADKFHAAALKHPEIGEVLTKLLAQRLGGQRRDVLSGKTFNKYRIVRGSHLENAGRVALKMLSHRLVYDKASLVWFHREADIVESFDHPNIVRMCGRFKAFKSYFIVMEFCDGITLERLVRLNGPLDQDDFRKAFGQIASAVLYAHQRDVVHRDIKPVNLMLNFDGTVKLMDFGLAKPINELEPTSEVDTHIVGTPRYMAPEQLKGREISEVTDYFALGCTAYKLLTGETLFPEHDVTKLRAIHDRWKVPDFSKHRPELAPDICELL
ncbi:MAG: putative serine/threonine protein kinase, partial [Planctomycetota bacterium]